MSKHKESTSKALERFYLKEMRRAEKETNRTKRKKNQKPEKLVERACLEWMRSQGWSVQIFESKATYDPKGFWRNQSMKAGNADCQGTLPSGRACYIEFKAKGKLSTFKLAKNYRQQMFLKEKILSNAFCAVVDSVELLKEIYERWEHLEKIEPLLARNYLYKKLPS
jgi:hypothetical protein